MHAATPTWTTIFLDFDAESYERGVAFWQGITGYGRSPMRGIDGELATLVPPDGDAHLRVQRLGSGATRLHVDHHVDDVEAAVPVAEELGARVTGRGNGFVVLASPGGFPFCLVPSGESVRTAPAEWPDGQRSVELRPAPPSPDRGSRALEATTSSSGARASRRSSEGAARLPRKSSPHASTVDQICLDIPPRLYEAEAAFWRDLTGWEFTAPTAENEFGSLRRPADRPVRFLLQRLDDEPDAVTAHLDLAATDRDAEVARHERLGARTVRRTSEWTVMADPTGWVYCVTDRDPETGTSTLP